MGADGRPFLQHAHARNISEHGAKLAGLEHELKPGDVIGVQLGEKKARCRVIWVVDAGAQKIEAGVKMVEGQSSPWQEEMKTQAPAPAPSRGTPAEGNRRKFPRQRIPLSLEISDEDGAGPHMKTPTADVNGRGCYVETLLPLPVGKNLRISFWLDSEKVTTSAIVRTCDGGVGMGIEFTGLDEATHQRLQRQVEAMAAGSSSSKSAQSTV
jgi:hypothetical protein